jgi:hypothetical protein
VIVRTSLESGWFFSPRGELRACTIITAGGKRTVRDTETGLYVDVKPDDVLIEKPEPENK